VRAVEVKAHMDPYFTAKPGSIIDVRSSFHHCVNSKLLALNSMFLTCYFICLSETYCSEHRIVSNSVPRLMFTHIKQLHNTPMEAQAKRGGIAPTHSRPRWVVSVTPRPRFTPSERTPGIHWTRGGWTPVSHRGYRKILIVSARDRSWIARSMFT
jgi:hypothetical protein